MGLFDALKNNVVILIGYGIIFSRVPIGEALNRIILPGRFNGCDPDPASGLYRESQILKSGYNFKNLVRASGKFCFNGGYPLFIGILWIIAFLREIICHPILLTTVCFLLEPILKKRDMVQIQGRRNIDYAY